MMQEMEMENKTLSCLINGHGCLVTDNILVPDSILVPEIVNSVFHVKQPQIVINHIALGCKRFSHQNSFCDSNRYR